MSLFITCDFESVLFSFRYLLRSLDRVMIALLRSLVRVLIAVLSSLAIDFPWFSLKNFFSWGVLIQNFVKKCLNFKLHTSSFRSK